MADYYSVIATAVSRLPSQTDEARSAIYDRARTALREALRDYEPPLLAKEQMALDEAIRRALNPSAKIASSAPQCACRDRLVGRR